MTMRLVVIGRLKHEASTTLGRSQLRLFNSELSNSLVKALLVTKKFKFLLHICNC